MSKPRIADLERWYEDDASDSMDFFDLMEPAGPLLLRLARAAKAYRDRIKEPVADGFGDEVLEHLDRCQDRRDALWEALDTFDWGEE